MKAQDVSSKRAHAKDVILKIEELFSDLESKKIKVIALVTDSVAAYALAR
ncbi:21978_t:CDS:2 [Cetraspora pellucida]|uniref:21978_t:CDS:1 n=1 Tax=Cetraspora pellucida TaxID=1433469 RepID=A0A9N9NVK0_9GLOM|nr:21978_t:CDS:2 [Cetraspora pellucida]